MKMKSYLFVFVSLFFFVSSSAIANIQTEKKVDENCLLSVDRIYEFSNAETAFTTILWLNWLGKSPKYFQMTYAPDMWSKWLSSFKKTDFYEFQNKRYTEHVSILESMDEVFFPGFYQYYGDAPKFKKIFPPNENSELYEKVKRLPPAELISDFYAKFDVGGIWKENYEDIYGNYLQKFNNGIKQGISNSYCITGMKPDEKIRFVILPLNFFGTSFKKTPSSTEGSLFVELKIDDFTTNDEALKEGVSFLYSHMVLDKHIEGIEHILQPKIDQIKKG